MTDTKDWECPDLATFEARYGSEVTEDILTRICEELWSRDSQFGIDVHDVESLDTLGDNVCITGLVEHEHAWYSFSVKCGTSYGTHVDYFELAETAPDEALVPDAPPQQLQAALVAHTEAHSYLNTARHQSMSRLRHRHRKGSVAAQPRQVHELLGCVLADVAVQHQDYALDALALARRAMNQADGMKALYPELSCELRELIAQTARQSAWLGAPEDFFVAGMTPVTDTAMLRY